MMDYPANSSLAGILFGEEQGRYVVAIPRDQNERLIEFAEARGAAFTFIGDTGGDDLNIGDAPGYSGHVGNIPLADLRAAHEGFFPALMQGEL